MLPRFPRVVCHPPTERAALAQCVRAQCAVRGSSTAPGACRVNDQARRVGEPVTWSVLLVVNGRAVLWDHRVRRYLGQAESPPLEYADNQL